MEVKGFSSLKEGRGWYLEACKYTGSSGRAGPDLTASAGGKRWRDGKDKGSCLSAIQMNCLYFYCTYEGLVWSCVLFMLSSCQQALFYARNETEPRFLLPNDSLVLPTAVWSGRSASFAGEGLWSAAASPGCFHLLLPGEQIMGSNLPATGSRGDRSLHRGRNSAHDCSSLPYELNGILPLLLWDPHPPRDSSKQEKSCQHIHTLG